MASKALTIGVCLGFVAGLLLPAGDGVAQDFGPLYQDFKLTLEPGERSEAVGPLYYYEQTEFTRTWAIPGLVSDWIDRSTDAEELQVAYPILTYNRYGDEYRFQLFQLFAFSGGRTMLETNVDRFTLFPVYFQQRSPDPALSYTAVFPLYGTLKNRLFRDEIQWVLWPLYAKTLRKGSTAPVQTDEFSGLADRFIRARKGAITTYNYLVPLFHLRYGEGLKGWQFWPLMGHEHKSVTSRTNLADEVEIVGGHDRFFALWPLFFNYRSDLGTTNAGSQQALLPFYSVTRSPARDATSYLWPFGFNVIDDRARQYREWDLFWPLVVFARGEGKFGNRVLPFFSVMRNRDQERRLYAWPLYRYVHLKAPPLDRERHRILYFLYSDLTERHLETGQRFHRVDAWPLFSSRRDFEGKQRLQILALLEPLLPASESVERNYSPLWALWRSEQNPRTGAASQSLLWNTYRRQTTPTTEKISLLFGLFRYQSGPDGTRWRLFYLPMGTSGKTSAVTSMAP